MSETIKVAIRVRPLVQSEKNRGCQSCVEVSSYFPQVIVNNDKAFTFDYVFDQDAANEDLYQAAVQKLIYETFNGFNVTIFAYGQTGSGKTFTMGTNYSGDGDMGVIPRAVQEIFRHISENTDWDVRVSVSFLELYNEQLYDLFSSDRSCVDIREDTKGICLPGLTEKAVKGYEETMTYLQHGAKGRVTGATAMNEQSSRSHAIFTINIHKQSKTDANTATSSKFHLVDLAGSERSKKTQAEGERFREGVNINNGLLHLGNLMQALGEGSKQVPSYRNSKLTRLLQDSLGGNSLTLMIACVSPADYNFIETTSTLRYADRAKKIKNKPIVNQDSKAAELAALKLKLQELQLQLSQGQQCPQSHEHLEEEVKSLNAKLRLATQRYSDALSEKTHLCEKALLAENFIEKTKQKTIELENCLKAQIEILEKVISTNPSGIASAFKSFKQNIQSNFTTLWDNYKQNESEIREHEKTSEVTSEITSSELDSEVDIEELNRKQEDFTNLQTKLDKELKEVVRQLALKEEIKEKYIDQDSAYSNSINLKHQYEKQIKQLENEREELLNSIKVLKSERKESELKTKQSELNKKDQEISILHKKLENQAKLIKQKEAAENKVSKLSEEIMAMKTLKVKLIRDMRQESEKFKHWKQLREREAVKLIDQDRKRQNEMAKMVTLHNKQQNVYKRKLEEAAACNKRLKDALSRQKVAQELRKKMRGNKDQIQEWVAHELDVLVSTVEAERTLEQLLQHRAALSDRVMELNAIITDNRIPKEEKELAESEIASLEKDVGFRNAQIVDFQQKILDSDQENKSSTRWEVIQSMSDAKAALKHSFQLVAEIKKELIVKDSQLKEIQAQHSATLQEKQNIEKQLKKEIKILQEEKIKLEQEYQDNINNIIWGTVDLDKENQNPKMNTTFILEKQIEEKDKILEEKESEVQELHDKLQLVYSTCAKTPRSKRTSVHREFEDLDIDEDGSFMLDDRSRDPDYRGTPLYKRIRESAAVAFNTTVKTGPLFLGKSNNNQKSKSNDSKSNDSKSRKRGADGTLKCSCLSDCKTKRCNCTKLGSKCTTLCACNPAKCWYKLHVEDDGLFDTTLALDEDEDEKFKKPRYTFTLNV